MFFKMGYAGSFFALCSLNPKHALRAPCPFASLVPPLSHPCLHKGETRVVNKEEGGKKVAGNYIKASLPL